MNPMGLCKTVPGQIRFRVPLQIALQGDTVMHY